jgi:hypothetical protein
MLDWHNWTVDKIELQLERADVRQAMKDGHSSSYNGFDKMLQGLKELADSPVMRNTVRQLNVPKLVTVNRQGKQSLNRSPRNLEGNNKYSFSLNDIKESVELTVTGNEYTTPPRRITLVPPPSVVRLTIDKEEPAYIHYRLPGDEPLLKGKRQLFRGVPMSTTGGKTVIAVPLGSTLTVTGMADRDLRDLVRVAEPARREEPGSITPAIDARLLADKRTFEATFKSVARVIEFDFEFRDVDNVKGRRHIVIKPVDDKAPNLVGIALAAILRPDYDVEGGKAAPSKFGERFLITPNARLPFKGVVSDDHGLFRVEFPYTVVQVPFQKIGESGEAPKPEAPPPPEAKDGKPREQFAQMIAGLYDLVPGAAAPRLSPAQLESISFLAILESVRVEPRARPEKGTVDLESFLVRATQRNVNDVTFEEMERLLQIQPRNRPLALELLDLKGEAEQKQFLTRLREMNQEEAVLTDVVHFLKMTPTERSALLGLVKTRPEEAVRGIIDLSSADKDEQERVKELLRKQPERTLIREWSMDLEGGFDVAKYLSKLKMGPGETQQRHYELQIHVSATDNNVETGPTTAPPKGPFVFLVISENELLAEIIKQERKLHQLLKEAVDDLDAREGAMKLALSQFSAPNPDMVFVAVRADNARKSLRDAGDIARGVLEKYNIILTEMEVNRIEGDKIARVATRIIKPLARLTNKSEGDFGAVERMVTGAWRDLEEDLARLKKAELKKAVTPDLLRELEDVRPLRRLAVESSGKQMAELIRRLREVLEAMQDIGTEAALIAELVRIEAARRENHRQIVRYRDDLIGSFFGPDPKQKK